MSSWGELFINEDCRDAFKEQIDKELSVTKWTLRPKHQHINNCTCSDIPSEFEVEIVDDDNTILGTGVIKVEFAVINQYGDRSIDGTPESITIRKV